jgi:hypothetical protein
MRGKNYFWGLFFITAAAVILVNQLGLEVLLIEFLIRI